MKDFVAILVIVGVLGLAVGYIIKAKKNGAKCIGCSASGGCPSKNGGACNCHKG